MDFLTKYENETGFVLNTGKQLPEFKDRDAFMDYVGEHRFDFTQVQLNIRKDFLEANGYKLNRKNLINVDLSDQITAEPDPSTSLVEELQKLDEASNETGPALPPPPAPES